MTGTSRISARNEKLYAYTAHGACNTQPSGQQTTWLTYRSSGTMCLHLLFLVLPVPLSVYC